MRKNKRRGGPRGGRRWTRSEPLVTRQVSPFASRFAFFFASKRANAEVIRIALLRGETAWSDRPAESRMGFQSRVQLFDTVIIIRCCCNVGREVKGWTSIRSVTRDVFFLFFRIYNGRKSLMIQSDEISHVFHWPDFGFQASKIKRVSSIPVPREESERERGDCILDAFAFWFARIAKKYFRARRELFSWSRGFNVKCPRAWKALAFKRAEYIVNPGRVDLNRPVARWRRTPIEPPIEGGGVNNPGCTHSFFHSREMDVEARCGRQPKCASIPSAEMIEFRRNWNWYWYFFPRRRRRSGATRANNAREKNRNISRTGAPLNVRKLKKYSICLRLHVRRIYFSARDCVVNF